MDIESPLLFISHKHADKAIADLINSFITMQSGGRIKVFQSSSPWANAPKAGRNLNQQLREALWQTRVLILVYTSADYDWNYCMWECGVASHPDSSFSKIIVFQCGDAVPTLFTEQVNINARDLVDIQRFANEFLTDPKFFPGFDAAITRFLPNSHEVASAAAEFSKKLLQPGILPPDKVDPDDEWPAYPYMQFLLSGAEIDKIAASDAKQRSKTGCEIVRNEAVILKADKYAEQLFGVPGFPAAMKLKDLEALWRDKHPDSDASWVLGLASQILDGVLWRFPTAGWELMRSVNSDDCYAPIMNRVRKVSSGQCMQFDVYFYKFDDRTAKCLNQNNS